MAQQPVPAAKMHVNNKRLCTNNETQAASL